MTFKLLNRCSYAALAVAFLTQTAYAHNAKLPDDHAPIGVMGDHNHKAGEVMFSYRFGSMKMDGNRDGTDDLSTQDVLDQFPVAPLEMDMQMHMFGAMYGVTGKLTIMGMVPYVQKSMDHITRTGVRFTTKANGIGDAKLSGLYTIYDSGVDSDIHRTSQKVLLNLGVSLPTGSTDERDRTPAGPNQKLPYPMQLGSGTVDPMLGVTFFSKHAGWSWGGQAKTVLRFGENDEGYRMGNEYGLTGWIAKNLTSYASVSFRLDGMAWSDYEGQDNDLNTRIIPTARTDLRGGERVDASVGLNLYNSNGPLAGGRVAAEFGMPVYQNLDGPQLETDYRFTLGVQYAF